MYTSNKRLRIGRRLLAASLTLALAITGCGQAACSRQLGVATAATVSKGISIIDPLIRRCCGTRKPQFGPGANR